MKERAGRIRRKRCTHVVLFSVIAFLALSAEVCLTNGDSSTVVWKSDGEWWIGIWCDGDDPDEDAPADTSECEDLDSVTQSAVEISCIDPDGNLVKLRCW